MKVQSKYTYNNQVKQMTRNSSKKYRTHFIKFVVLFLIKVFLNSMPKICKISKYLEGSLLNKCM